MDINSPPVCPNTVTVRRNPHRRARPTPHSAVPLSLPPSSKTSSAIRSFPIDDILSIDIPPKHQIPHSSSSDEQSDPEKLKVFLRIRPIVTQQKGGGSLKAGAQRNVWPQNPKKKDAAKMAKAGGKKKVETCLKVNDSHSVTLCPPQSLADVRRTKSEVYEGFSHVFSDDSSQSEVYEKMMSPLVVDFLKGKSGMLAAMGPSGSGKTHTVFGSTRQPGMVSLALRQIFSQKESGRSKCSRNFYLSIFEIYSERGKGEKIMDLSQEGGDLYMQQSNIKGLKEEVIHDVQHAESLIASAMLKRSTAMTNSNIQSSRSQCIINIRCDLENLDEDQSCTAVLTIVDLAGAEREKRTGNQGARLLESNFINNTSMVFGLCLRSLLEHQKNPKKPLHKHFQNSMLTKYLRDFLEGKKRMALILTAKPGEEDYQDTSYLLRQASPFMNIKFESIEEQPLGNKRRTQTLPKVDTTKRMKLNNNEVCMDDDMKDGLLHQPHKEELIPESNKEVENNGSSFQFPININIKANKNKSITESSSDAVKKARENTILSNFSRALWKVLKEYKNKLEASENEADSLRHSLTAEKERCAALETELTLLKASCSCGKIPMVEENDGVYSEAQVSSSHSIKIECTKEKQITPDTVTTSVTLLSDCSNMANLENQICNADTQVSCSSLCDEDNVDSRVVSSSNADAQVSCSTLCEEDDVDSRVLSSINDTSSAEVASTSLNVQNFEELNEENNVPCEYVVFDKEDLMELGDTKFSDYVAGYNNLESDVTDLKLLLHGDEVPFSAKGDQRKHEEEESNAHDSSSDLSESDSFQKQNILDNAKVDVTSPNAMLDKQEFKESEERETDGETTVVGRDNLESAVCDLELHVHGTKSCSVVKGDQVQHEEDSSSRSSESWCLEKQDIMDDMGISFVEVTSISDDLEKSEDQSKEGLSFVEVTSISADLEKSEDQSTEKIGVKIPNLVCDKQESKEVEERDADGEVTDEISSCLEEVQPEHEEKEEAPDQQSILPEDAITSQSCNASKLPEVPSVQPSQSFTAVKPKRRLRPASSVMLKNINILEFDDATTLPKQRNGKRGENEDGGKRTQGSISLLRILKQNLHH